MTKTKVPFNCTSSIRDGITIFHLKGRLMDQQQADELIEHLEAQLPKESANVVLDMEELEYMNSTGLNIMISVLTKARNAGGEVVISNVSKAVRQLFLVTKLDTVFAIHDSVEEGVAHFDKG